MTVLVDTSVWSLALRRDRPANSPTVAQLTKALESDLVVTTGLIAQLCITHDLELLSTDRDFVHASHHCDLRLWSGSDS